MEMSSSCFLYYLMRDRFGAFVLYPRAILGEHYDQPVSQILLRTEKKHLFLLPLFCLREYHRSQTIYISSNQSIIHEYLTIRYHFLLALLLIISVSFLRERERYIQLPLLLHLTQKNPVLQDH